MEKRKIIYIGIILICVLAILAAIVEEVVLRTGEADNHYTKPDTTETGKGQEELKIEFDSIFNNVVNYNGFDASNITKLDNTKELVYCAFSLQESQENRYEVNIYLPIININNDVVYNFNLITQRLFADTATQILNKEEGTTTIYSVEYTGYINENILSVVIKSTLKDGSNAQRIIVQTYNYNLQTGQQTTIYDALEQRGVTEEEVTTKIQNQISQAIDEAKLLQNSGYSIYERNLDDDIYKIENSSEFFLGEDGSLYIIYAYGNSSYTTEMDIIQI